LLVIDTRHGEDNNEFLVPVHTLQLYGAVAGVAVAATSGGGDSQVGALLSPFHTRSLLPRILPTIMLELFRTWQWSSWPPAAWPCSSVASGGARRSPAATCRAGRCAGRDVLLACALQTASPQRDSRALRRPGGPRLPAGGAGCCARRVGGGRGIAAGQGGVLASGGRRPSVLFSRPGAPGSAARQ
jgi:hypothetical protein